MFEGGLRKWFLPSLASPLLIIRDPIALFILIKAIKANILKFNSYLVVLLIVSIVSIPLAIYLGHGNLAVAIFGARIFFLHFPLIFVIGWVFSYSDVIKLGKVVVIMLIPMTILIAFQFFSPQSSFVNIGVGGDEKGSGFAGAGEYFRPSGIFSFTSGNVMYYMLATTFLFFFGFTKKKYFSTFAFSLCSISFVIGMPFCISRSLFFQIGMSLIYAVVAFSRDTKILIQILKVVVAVYILFIMLNNFTFFQISTGAFTTRFTQANENEGGLNGVFIDRFLGGMLGAIFNDNPIPYFGYGIGLGTNVGAVLTTGAATFLIAEGEWGRLIGELGLILGLTIIILRGILGLDILIKAYSCVKENNLLPWFLMSWGLLSITQNQLGQPTALGFTVIVGGLAIASLKSENI